MRHELRVGLHGLVKPILEKLRDMGYYPLSVKPHKSKAGDVDLLALPGLKFIFHRIKRKHIMTFTRQLATLIDAGLPIIRTLTILREQLESIIFKEKVEQISKDIESGASLSEAFAKHPKVFDVLYVNMVRAGEIGGVLEMIIGRREAALWRPSLPLARQFPSSREGPNGTQRFAHRKRPSAAGWRSFESAAP